jgi:hypothetical protein
LTHPEYLLFVDKTGCNTNQKDDKYIGGELFVLPKKDGAGGVIGCTTNIHASMLCFTTGSALGDPVMCAVILKSNKKSNKKINDLPLSRKKVIDIQKDINKKGTRCELMRNNFGEGKTYGGGPKCTYLEKTIP